METKIKCHALVRYLPHPNNFMPKQCNIHLAIVWYHFGLALCCKSTNICEIHAYKHIYILGWAIFCNLFYISAPGTFFVVMALSDHKCSF